MSHLFIAIIRFFYTVVPLVVFGYFLLRSVARVLDGAVRDLSDIFIPLILLALAWPVAKFFYRLGSVGEHYRLQALGASLMSVVSIYFLWQFMYDPEFSKSGSWFIALPWLIFSIKIFIVTFRVVYTGRE